MKLGIPEVSLAIFMLTFIATLNMGILYFRDTNRFLGEYYYNAIKHKNIKFTGPQFNFLPFLALIFTGNCAIAVASFTDRDDLAVQTIAFLFHYAAFIMWVGVHILILRRQRFVDSLQVPWEA